MSIMDFENFIGIDQTEIAEFIGIARPNVARSIRKLREKGILVEGPKLGRHKSYQLNLQYAWKGKAANRQKELAKAYREVDAKSAAKPKAKKSPGSKKKVTKPAKVKAKLKLIKQKDGEL
jgi:DNA-binding Lrp family transcriptional regulator